MLPHRRVDDGDSDCNLLTIAVRSSLLSIEPIVTLTRNTKSRVGHQQNDVDNSSRIS
jgi:hypothetical protein